MIQERLIPIVLGLLLACAGCAGRLGATPAEVTPAGVQKSPPQPAPAPPFSGTGSQEQAGAPVETAPAPPPSAAKTPAPAGEAPPPIASAYIYSPQQAADLPDGPSAPPQGKDASLDLPEGELRLLVVASAVEVAFGEVVTVDVLASSSTAVIDAPLHLTFDPNVVEFVDGAPGDFLTQGGSSVVFLADGRSRPGDVAIAAGRVVREQGASGSGRLCRVRFRGVGAGTTAVSVGQAKAWGAAGEPLIVRSTGTTVAVR